MEILGIFHEMWINMQMFTYGFKIVKRSTGHQVIICDRIWEKQPSMHTTTRHTFHHQMIPVHVD